MSILAWGRGGEEEGEQARKSVDDRAVVRASRPNVDSGQTLKKCARLVNVNSVP